MTKLIEFGRSPKKRITRKKKDQKLMISGFLFIIIGVMLILLASIAPIAKAVSDNIERLKMEWEIREEIINKMKEEQRELHAQAEAIRNNTVSEKFVGNFKITTYYTPIATQTRTDRNYHQDLAVNCQGDCFVTASGYRLQPSDAFQVLACPPNFEFGTKLKLKTSQGEIVAVCQDRGGSIKGNRLDLYVGVGDDAHIGKYSGIAEVYEI